MVQLSTVALGLASRQAAHNNTKALVADEPYDGSLDDDCCDDTAAEALTEAQAQALALAAIRGRNLVSGSELYDHDLDDDVADGGCSQGEGGGGSSGGWRGQKEAGPAGAGQEGYGDDFAWWSSWEADVAKGAGGGGAGGTSAPTAADEEEGLWHISMQELLAEVDRRQAGVFSPKSLEDVARLPVERQKRLRVARSVLASRLQCQRAGAVESAAGAVQHTGGFLSSADGPQDDADHGWDSWKRQRL
eukprot:gene3953-4205_t